MDCVLRPGNTHASRQAEAVLKRLARRLKKAYPQAEIVLRADKVSSYRGSTDSVKDIGFITRSA